MAFLNLFPGSAGRRKELALQAIGKANSTLIGNTAVEDFADAKTKRADAGANLDAARSDTAFVGLGLSLLLSALAVNALNYGLFSSLGTTGVHEDLDRFVTALAAAGGSKAVHELIGRLQKAKEASEATAKTA